ncbi:MAG: sulfatase-like hydrolase/transferase [Emcibacteraceae bacterium]
MKKLAYLVFIIVGYFFSLSMALAEKQWNILAIVPDDHARRVMGAYGDKKAVTPNFDQLAAEGVRFTNAYAAAPVCSPSRAAFWSGKYPSQVGVSDFLMLNEKYADRGLETSAVLWPEVLKKQGYKTGLIGKWHLGEATERHPLKRGFDYFVGYEQDSKAFDPILDENGKVREVKGHTSDLFVGYAKDFLNSNKDKKFALTIMFREPQRPWYEVPEEDIDAVRNVDPDVPDEPGIDRAWLKKMTHNYYGAVHALDRAVGEVLAELDRLGLSENTIVIYAGDHGMVIGQHGYFGRGAVGAIAGDHVVGSENIANLFEEAITIPMIIRWPGVAKSNSVVEMPVSNTDIYPTILSMLGLQAPKDYTTVGHDLSSALKGKEEGAPRPVFAQYNMENFGIAHLRMVRFGDWKLIKRFKQGANAELLDELYNLKTDPQEKENLIAVDEHQQIRKDLEAMLKKWMTEINDPDL